jgi:hypothetical protein
MEITSYQVLEIYTILLFLHGPFLIEYYYRFYELNQTEEASLIHPEGNFQSVWYIVVYDKRYKNFLGPYYDEVVQILYQLHNN